MTGARRSLFVVLAVAAALPLGCAGGDEGDDDDDGTNPIDPTNCQIVWVTRDPPGQTNLFDYYLVDAPVVSWESGSLNYFVGDPTGAQNVTGAWVDDYDLVARQYAQAALATSGEFTLALTSAGIAAGAPIELSDDEGQEYFLLNEGGELSDAIGLGGTGSFDGVWSTPGTPDVAEGSGTITIAYFGTSLTLGVDVAFAQCYEDDEAFAPATREDRLRRAGEVAGAVLQGL